MFDAKREPDITSRLLSRPVEKSIAIARRARIVSALQSSIAGACFAVAVAALSALTAVWALAALAGLTAAGLAAAARGFAAETGRAPDPRPDLGPPEAWLAAAADGGVKNDER